MLRPLLTLMIFLSLSVVAAESGDEFFLDEAESLNLELLIAESSIGDPRSLMGQSSLRMKSKNQDHVLSFIPYDENEVGLTGVMKAVIGMYPTAILIEEFSSYVKRVAVQEEREIKRFILPSDPEISFNIKEQLKLVQKGEVPETSYFLLSHNENSVLYKFLGEVGYFINKAYHKLTPQPGAKNFRTIFLTPVLLGMIELSPIKSRSAVFAALVKKSKLDRLRSSTEVFQALINRCGSLSTEDLGLLLSFKSSHLAGRRSEVLNELRLRGVRTLMPLEVLLGARKVSDSLYRMCADKTCAEDLVRNLEGDRKSLRRSLYAESSRSRQLSFGQELERTKQFRHSQLLIESLEAR